jgi:transposase
LPPRQPRSSGCISDPPEGALAVAVDEKPHLQALERAQGYLKLPNGRAVSGRRRLQRGTAPRHFSPPFNIANGEVTARPYKRRRRVKFLDFMNRLISAHRGREIHVILDNLKTHKPKRDGWRARHKNVHFSFTPSHASLLTQVECWFSILGGQSLQPASFTSVAQLRAH